MFPAVDHDPSRGTEWPGDREDLSRGPGDNLGLEPAVLLTLSGMQLPDDVCRDSTKITYEHVVEFAVADRASHGSANADEIPGQAMRGLSAHCRPAFSINDTTRGKCDLPHHDLMIRRLVMDDCEMSPIVTISGTLPASPDRSGSWLQAPVTLRAV